MSLHHIKTHLVSLILTLVFSFLALGVAKLFSMNLYYLAMLGILAMQLLLLYLYEYEKVQKKKELQKNKEQQTPTTT